MIYFHIKNRTIKIYRFEFVLQVLKVLLQINSNQPKPENQHLELMVITNHIHNIKIPIIYFILIFPQIILVMKTEMAHSASKEAVEKFDKNNMKHVETQEKNPLPDGEGNLYFFKKCTIFLALGFLNNFDSKVRNGSEHTKIIIFYTFFSAIRLETEHNNFKAGIEGFDKDKLSKAETVEKNTLPTKEVIEEEKKA